MNLSTNKLGLRKSAFISALAITVLGNATWAQSIDKVKLDSYFDTLNSNNKFMGSVALTQQGKLIYTRAIGFADVDNKLLANEQTSYRIGSISKTFTAVLVMKAMEEKKLDINQTIDKFFPAIKNADRITVKQLMNHSSGIHNFTNDEDYLTWHTKAKSEKEMVDLIGRMGSDFEPGAKSEYSNSNYVLLTYIVEKSLKRSYAEALQKYIAKPLGLKHTALGGKIDAKANQALSYKYTGNWQLEAETDISIPQGAGGVVATASDLVAFSDGLFGGKLLKKESLDLMKTLQGSFGLGLFTLPFDNKTSYGHTGGIDGFASIFTHFDQGNISYAMVSNGTHMNTNDVSLTVLSAAYNKPITIPDFKIHEVSAAELDQYIGVYASEEMPLKITITKEGKTLMAQATGQSAFPLEATEKDKFKFDIAGIVLEFAPADSGMVLKQGGGQYTFKKE